MRTWWVMFYLHCCALKAEPEFVGFAQDRFPAWGAGKTTSFDAQYQPTRLHRLAKSIPRLHKRLQSRALIFWKLYLFKSSINNVDHPRGPLWQSSNIISKIDGNDDADDVIIGRSCCPDLTVFFSVCAQCKLSRRMCGHYQVRGI